ncbi:50S ribosomal protein L18e [Candidatus Woesearchaeota archaeon]|nr:50S ribosomal protein L18e [Candidatus Woesearchaeota archaeon]
MRTGTANPELRNLIKELKVVSSTQKAPFWKRLALDLEKPTRKRREVNISRINKFAKQNETIVIPGKVLGAGEISKSVTVAAWQFSEQAKEKIIKAKGSCLSIEDLIKKKPKVSEVRTIG